MKKYGLQLRIQPQNRQSVRPLVSLLLDLVITMMMIVMLRDIARQSISKRALKEIEEQQKKALEEDPSVFDYDGVYEQMKEEQVRPLVQDRQQRQSKYIQRLMEKAKEREREHEIIYERKLAKERSKDEHLFADKDKFVTSAYKKKLAENEKWMQEERLRELREERDDVTKKSDISDFYFNLSKNVAFGAKKTTEHSKQIKPEEKINSEPPAEEILPKINSPSNSEKAETAHQSAIFTYPGTKDDSSDVKTETNIVPQGNIVKTETNSVLQGNIVKTETNSVLQGNIVAEQPSARKKEQDHCKKNEEALAAAKERFLARKKAKNN